MFSFNDFFEAAAEARRRRSFGRKVWDYFTERILPLSILLGVIGLAGYGFYKLVT